MKKAFIYIAFFLLACGENVEFSVYQPANPPSGVELIHLTAENGYEEGTYTGDHLLLFRSENKGNQRFGGFLIFVYSEEEVIWERNLLQSSDFEGKNYEEMNSNEKLAFDSVINMAGYTLAGYNSGIDSQVVILFSDIEEDISPITVGDNDYSVSIKFSKDNIVSNYQLTLRTYLVNELGAKVTVSKSGNPVQIQP